MIKFGKIPTGLDLLNYFVSLTTFSVTAAVGVIGAAVASRGARKSAQGAAAAQERAASSATAEQRRQFNISQKQAEPFRQAGLGALEQQQALLGLTGPEAQQQAMQAFQESPGQAFLRERGQQAILRGASATGGLGGARVQEALQQQGIGFAQQDLQNQLARLSGIAGQGQAVTQNIAGLGAQTAGNIGQLMQAGGQAQASGILGAGAAKSRFIGQATPVIGRELAGMFSGSGATAAPAFGGQVTSQPSVFNQPPTSISIG